MTYEQFVLKTYAVLDLALSRRGLRILVDKENVKLEQCSVEPVEQGKPQTAVLIHLPYPTASLDQVHGWIEAMPIETA